MKYFLLGLVIGASLLGLIAAAVPHTRKAVGIANYDNNVFVLYDDGSVFVNAPYAFNSHLSARPWTQWTPGVAEHSDAQDAFQAIQNRYGNQ